MMFSLLAAIGCQSKSTVITIFAASSTQVVIPKLIENYPAEVVVSYASSGALARQITQGAPADVYISANPQWMEYLVQQDAIMQQRPLVQNQLVLVSNHPSTVKSLATIDVETTIAIGDPAHVPAGMYAKQALSNLDLWKPLGNRLVVTNSGRKAAMLVERGEVDYGIVYHSDAVLSEKLNEVYPFPSETHSPIVYSAAVTKHGDRLDTFQFLQSLFSDQAKEIWVTHGFQPQ